jgi:2-dehydropantoate 2-reductase
MRIAVIGTGGVGGCFGAALAKAGVDVTFLARGAHLAAMRESGLRIEGGRGETIIRPVQATDDIALIGPVDIVLFCVKLWDLEHVAGQISSLIRAATAVIPLQNGIDASDGLAAILGPEATMNGTAMVSATIDRPGVVRQTGTMMTLTFGERDGRFSRRAERFRELCEMAGFEVVLSDNIRVPLWVKFIGLTAFSGCTALTRLPIGPVREHPETFALLVGALREAEAVGRAEGVALPSDVVEKNIQLARSIPPETTASMAVDLALGRRLELPWLAGKVVALGRKHGVPTPLNDIIYAALLPHTNGTRAAS